LEFQQRLERRRCQAPTRTCRACASQWFALPQFFPVQRPRLANRVKVSMAKTCRICKMKLKQEHEGRGPARNSVKRSTAALILSCVSRSRYAWGRIRANSETP
jgi:hypothetical protein